jgi:hypothetical protein
MAQAAAQRVGYANGGDAGPPATSPPQPDTNDINHRAALLAGLRKRYDAMIGMAQGAHAHGNLKAAAHLATKAHDMVPDGKNLTHHVTPDGHILAVVHSPQGGVHTTHSMSPEQFHHYLVGPATSFDHVLENGAHKNLAIASGGQHTPVAEHPNDPIHRVRQVLHHTRKMFGVDKIGQAAPPVGYGAGD